MNPANSIKNILYDPFSANYTLNTQLFDELDIQLKKPVYDKLSNQLDSQLFHQLYNRLFLELRNNVTPTLTH
jgi:hypothetical protein